MLANIFAPLGQYMIVDDIMDLGKDIVETIKKQDSLPVDAPPQFAAGLLYGYTDQTVDKRDYILGCNHTGPYVRHQLGKAFEAYLVGDDAKGNKHMQRAEPFWRLSMVTCFKTNKYFNKIDHEKDAFLAREDFSDVVQDNYTKNKDYIDSQWSQALKTWEEGVYFNSGMFYARTFKALIATDATDLPF